VLLRTAFRCSDTTRSPSTSTAEELAHPRLRGRYESLDFRGLVIGANDSALFPYILEGKRRAQVGLKILFTTCHGHCGKYVIVRDLGAIEKILRRGT